MDDGFYNVLFICTGNSARSIFAESLINRWGVPDPAVVEGDKLARLAAFVTAFREFQNRISIFVNLPFDSLDSLRLQEKLDEIGRTRLTVPTAVA